MRRPVRNFALLIILVSSMLAQVGVVLADNVNQSFAPPIVVVNTSFLNVRTGPSAQFAIATTVVGGTELPVLGTAGDNVWYQVSTPVGVGWVNIEFVIPRGDFTNVPLVSVEAQPTTPVIVDFAGTANQPAVSPAIVTSPIEQPNAPAAANTTATTGTKFRAVPNQVANVYAEPDVNSASIRTLFDTDPSIDYPVVGVTSGFIGVEIPGAGRGWVEENKIDIRLARTMERDVVIITSDNVAFSSSPGGSSANPPFLSSGDEGYLLDISSDSQFVKIELGNGTQGWVPFGSQTRRTGTLTDENPVSMSAVPMQSVQPGTSNAPIIDNTLGQGGGGGAAPAVAPAIIAPPVAQFNTNIAVVNTSFLNVRSGPGAQYTAVFTARGGNELNVLGVASDGVWFLVQGPFGQGWVNNEFVIFRGSIQEVPVIRNASGVIATPVAVIGGAVSLYAAPGTNFGLLGTIPGPVEAPIVARTSDFAWIQINTSAGFGWVLAEQISVRGDATLIPVVAN